MRECVDAMRLRPLTVAEIAARYGVHRATAYRWLKADSHA